MVCTRAKSPFLDGVSVFFISPKSPSTVLIVPYWLESCHCGSALGHRVQEIKNKNK